MQKNLFQKTLYEVYKFKEALGYKIIETPHMFVILWRDPAISGLNVAHCEKFTNEEYNFLKKELQGIEVCIASNNKAEVNCPKLKSDEIAHVMLFESCQLLKEDDCFEIRLAENKQVID